LRNLEAVELFDISGSRTRMISECRSLLREIRVIVMSTLADDAVTTTSETGMLRASAIVADTSSR